METNPAVASVNSRSSLADSTRVGTAWAQLAAWSVLAVVDAVYIAVAIPLPPSGLGTRALHHVYDAALLLAVGAIAGLAADAWARVGPRRRGSGYAALFALSAVVATLVLPGDVEGVAADLPGPEALWRFVLIGAAAVAIPAAAATRALARLRYAIAAPGAVGLAAAVANELVLPNDYPGIHLFIGWTAATLLAASLARTPVPARLGVGPNRTGLVARAAIACAASASVWLAPNGRVVLELFKVPGAVLVPFLSRSTAGNVAAVTLPPTLASWSAERRALPDIAPSAARALPPDAIVLLVVVDALRAEAVSDPAHATLFPNLLSLRRNAVEFTRARAASSSTVPSMASVFTSRYFSQLRYRLGTIGRRQRYFPYDDPSTRFPELLQRAGVSTAAFFTLDELDPERGIVRGIAEITHRPSRTLAPELARAVIGRLRTADGPLFVYLHLADAHAPYDRGGTDGTPYERYLKEVRIVDDAIGQLLAAIRAPRLAARTAIIVTADHGEAFGEHNDWSHSHTVYDELLRVPLLVRAPGVAPRAIDVPVSLLDLGPTVLDLFGLPTPAPFMGQTLVPFLRGEPPTLTRPIAADSMRAQRSIVFPDGWKVIEDRRRGIVEQYDLSRDPGELDNVYPSRGRDDPHLGWMRAFFAAAAHHDDGYVPPYFVR